MKESLQYCFIWSFSSLSVVSNLCVFSLTPCSFPSMALTRTDVSRHKSNTVSSDTHSVSEPDVVLLEVGDVLLDKSPDARTASPKDPV